MVLCEQPVTDQRADASACSYNNGGVLMHCPSGCARVICRRPAAFSQQASRQWRLSSQPCRACAHPSPPAAVHLPLAWTQTSFQAFHRLAILLLLLALRMTLCHRQLLMSRQQCSRHAQAWLTLLTGHHPQLQTQLHLPRHPAQHRLQLLPAVLQSQRLSLPHLRLLCILQGRQRTSRALDQLMALNCTAFNNSWLTFWYGTWLMTWSF